MTMTSDAISRWLSAPATLPDGVDIDAALRAWPWFAPARLMEARKEHRQTPFSEKALTTLQLYGPEWMPAYMLLTQEEIVEEDEKQEAPLVNDLPVDEIAAADKELETAARQLMPEPEGDSQPGKLHPEPPFIQPLYTEDYFRHQGVAVADEIPEQPQLAEEKPTEPQTLMVMMSFAEWLSHFKTKTQKEEEEAQEKRALRSMWQQEKLAAALDDEPDEIPEDVFEMAVSSITKEDDIVSEPLAQIYERQEKWAAAADMYQKLARKYPAKSAYFVARADAAKKRLL